MAYNPVVENPQALALTAAQNRPQPTGEKYATGPQLLPQVRSERVGINAGAPHTLHQGAINKQKQEALEQGNRMLLEAAANKNALARQKLAYDNTLKANEIHRTGLRDEQLDKERRERAERRRQERAHVDTRTEAGYAVAVGRDWVNGGQKRFEDAVRNRHILEAVQTDPTMANLLTDSGAQPGTPAYLTEAAKIAQKHDLLKGERSQAIAREVREKGQEVGRRYDWGLAITQKTGHPMIMPGSGSGPIIHQVAGSDGLPIPTGALTLEQFVSGKPGGNRSKINALTELTDAKEDRIPEANALEAFKSGALAAPKAIADLNWKIDPTPAILQEFDTDGDGELNAEEFAAAKAAGHGEARVGAPEVVATTGVVLTADAIVSSAVSNRLNSKYAKELKGIPDLKGEDGLKKMSAKLQEEFANKHGLKWDDYKNKPKAAHKLREDAIKALDLKYKNRGWFKMLGSKKFLTWANRNKVKIGTGIGGAAALLTLPPAVYNTLDSLMRADDIEQMRQDVGESRVKLTEMEGDWNDMVGLPKLAGFEQDALAVLKDPASSSAEKIKAKEHLRIIKEKATEWGITLPSANQPATTP